MAGIGLQSFDIVEQKTKNIGDPGGFCALWSIWYADMRITYQDLDRKKLFKKMIKYIKSQNISFRNIIRNYSKNITLLRDSIFDSIGITINDWINDKYTQKHLLHLVDEINNILKS